MKPLFVYVVLISLAFGCALSSYGQASGEDVPEQDESWEVIYIGGTRIGYVHSRSWETEQDGARRIWTEEVSRMTIKRFGGTLSITTTQLTQETAEGKLLTFRHETDNPPISNVVSVGTIDEGTITLTRTAAGQTKTTSEDWDAEIMAPAHLERLLIEQPVQDGDTRSFKTYEPQYLKVAELTLHGQSPATTTLLDGSKRKLRRMTMTHSLIPGIKMTIYSDDEGNPVKMESPLMQMVTYTVSETEALKEIAGKELDLALSTLVKVAPIKGAHRSERIVYEMTLDRAGLLVELPVSPTQTVEQVGPQTYRITVTSARPDSTLENVERATSVEAKYLSCSRELECEHPAVIKLAEAAAGGRDDPVEIAVAMERYVHRTLKSKNFSTAQATAAEVATTLEGDCTEHAVLLAAMLRVKKIPSRVCVGLVYAASHSAFGGHMWTEALLNGRWVPLDATLGIGGIGAGHLKFADSSLDDDAPPPVTTFLPLISLLDHMTLRVIERE